MSATTATIAQLATCISKRRPSARSGFRRVKFSAMPSDTPIAVIANGIAIRCACRSAKRNVQNGNSVIGVTPFSGVGMIVRARLGPHQS